MSDTDTDTPATGELSATLTLSTEVPTVAFASWAPPSAGTSWVEFGLTGAARDRRTPDTTDPSDLTVLGLKAGKTYDWQAVTELADGSRLVSPVQQLVVPPVPEGIPRVVVTRTDPRAAMSTGYVMISIMTITGSWIAILDGEGDYVWYHAAQPNTLVTTSRPGLDGHSVLWASYDNKQEDDLGVIERYSIDGRQHTVTRTLNAHHDFYEHPDGTLAWLGYRFDDFGGQLIASDAVREAPEGTSEITDDQVFSWFEDYGHDPFVPSPTAASATVPYEGEKALEWTHSNSLMYDAADDDYYVMSKFMDALVKVDRSTGEVLWQINGMYGTFTDPLGADPWRAYDDTDLWSHAHMSHIWDDGAMVFDNGYHYTPERSSAIELQFDPLTGVVEKVWEYPEPSGGFTPLMGDVRLLSDTDTVLVAWSDLAIIEEVTHDAAKEQLWKLEPEGIGHIYGRIHFIRDLYQLDPP